MGCPDRPWLTKRPGRQCPGTRPPRCRLLLKAGRPVQRSMGASPKHPRISTIIGDPPRAVQMARPGHHGSLPGNGNHTPTAQDQRPRSSRPARQQHTLTTATHRTDQPAGSAPQAARRRDLGGRSEAGEDPQQAGLAGSRPEHPLLIKTLVLDAGSCPPSARPGEQDRDSAREDHEQNGGRNRADDQGTQTADPVTEEEHGARVPRNPWSHQQIR